MESVPGSESESVPGSESESVPVPGSYAAARPARYGPIRGRYRPNLPLRRSAAGRVRFSNRRNGRLTVPPPER